MKRLSETKAAEYTGPAPQETHWVRASDVLLVPFTLLRANNAKIKDGTEKAFLNVMFESVPLGVLDSLSQPLDTSTEYTISSGGRAIMDVVALLEPTDFPIGHLLIAGKETPNGFTQHTLQDVEQWQRQEQARDAAAQELDSIPF